MKSELFQRILYGQAIEDVDIFDPNILADLDSKDILEFKGLLEIRKLQLEIKAIESKHEE